MIRRCFVLVILIYVSRAHCEPVTLERVPQLPPADQAAWESYLERSAANARVDVDTLEAEVAANGLSVALRAPDGGDFKLSAQAGDSWYAGKEAGRLADVILSYQTPAGGWSKHTGYGHGPRQPGMQWTSQNEPGHSPHYVATFDNHSTTEQLHFLANVWQATHRNDCRAGFVKGLNFIYDAQYPNGGWPQVYPLEGDYHDDVTLNDDALAHILELLQAVGQGAPQFAFLVDAQRERAAEAFAAGLQCVIRMQIVRNGKLTAWCAQYDPLTLQPSRARALEPPTLSGMESAQLLKFMMTIPRPAPEVVESIEAGLSWLEQAKTTRPLERSKLGDGGNPAGATNTEICWARFYDLQTGRPVFPGRDGVLYDSFAAMAAKNPLGYDYYSTRPGSILTNGQKKWRKMLAKKADETPAE